MPPRMAMGRKTSPKCCYYDPVKKRFCQKVVYCSAGSYNELGTCGHAACNEYVSMFYKDVASKYAEALNAGVKFPPTLANAMNYRDVDLPLIVEARFQATYAALEATQKADTAAMLERELQKIEKTVESPEYKKVEIMTKEVGEKRTKVLGMLGDFSFGVQEEEVEEEVSPPPSIAAPSTSDMRLRGRRRSDDNLSDVVRNIGGMNLKTVA